MKHVEVDGKEYRIQFRHGEDVHVDHRRAGRGVEQLRSTRCSILLVDREHQTPEGRPELRLVAEGMTLCSKGDQYSKEKGRVEALKRALGAFTPDRPTWGKFWEVYNGRHEHARG